MLETGTFLNSSNVAAVCLFFAEFYTTSILMVNLRDKKTLLHIDICQFDTELVCVVTCGGKQEKTTTK